MEQFRKISAPQESENNLQKEQFTQVSADKEIVIVKLDPDRDSANVAQNAQKSKEAMKVDLKAAKTVERQQPSSVQEGDDYFSEEEQDAISDESSNLN